MKSIIARGNSFYRRKNILLSFVFSLFCLSLFTFLFYNFGYKQSFILIIALFAFFLFFKYPELGLVLSASTYLFKRWVVPLVPIFSQIDFTVFIFLLTFVSIIFYLIKNNYLFYIKFNKTISSFLIFGLFLLLSTLYTPAYSYGILKATSFLTFNFALFLFPMLVIVEKENVKRLVFFFLLLGSAYSLLTLYNLYSSFISGDIIYTYRASFLGINPIGFANWFGSVDVILITLLASVKNRTQKMGMYILILLFTIVIVVSNSRGPIISFFLTIIFLSAFRVKQIKWENAFYWALFFIILFIVLLNILPSQLTDRYTQLAKVSQINQRVSMFTINSRLDFWKAAIHFATDTIPHLFFGVGAGGFSELYFHLDFEAYPHNIFFEVFCELGLLGIVLIFWHFQSIFKYVFENFKQMPAQEKTILLAFTMAAVYNMIAAQFSSDLLRNRRIWFFLGVAIAIKSISNSEKKDSPD